MTEDKKLYTDFLNGNNKSFDKLIIKYRTNLKLFINNYVHNTDTSEDLSQDVFLYIIIHKTEYDFKYSFKTYLFTIAKCRAINYITRTKHALYLDDYADLLPSNEDLNDLIIKKDIQKIMQKNIKRLNKKYQTVIYLAYFENFKYKEIAKILNKTIPQIKMMIYRAKKELKEIIRKEDYSNE